MLVKYFFSKRLFALALAIGMSGTSLFADSNSNSKVLNKIKIDTLSYKLVTTIKNTTFSENGRRKKDSLVTTERNYYYGVDSIFELLSKNYDTILESHTIGVCGVIGYYYGEHIIFKSSQSDKISFQLNPCRLGYNTSVLLFKSKRYIIYYPDSIANVFKQIFTLE